MAAAPEYNPFGYRKYYHLARKKAIPVVAWLMFGEVGFAALAI
jgi:hypothetical protein